MNLNYRLAELQFGNEQQSYNAEYEPEYGAFGRILG
jgi:hypothetical protein